MVRWSYRCGHDLFDIKVGYACNNRCVHCAIDWVQQRLADDGQPQNLTTEQIKRLIDGAVRRRARSVVLTGGEVTIRRDFEALVHYVLDRGLSLIIHTNGCAFANKALASRVASLPGLSFVVSLHASQADIHDGITRRRGSFDQVSRGTRYLREGGALVVAKFVLLRRNRDEAIPTMELARTLGVNEFCLAFPYFASHQVGEVPRYREVAGEIRAACLHAESVALPLTFETIPYCIVPDLPQMWKQSCDLPRGARAGCRPSDTSRPAANASDWDRLRAAMKVKANSCASCVFDRICEGPWCEYAEAFGLSEFEPVPYESVEPFLSRHNAASCTQAGE